MSWQASKERGIVLDPIVTEHGSYTIAPYSLVWQSGRLDRDWPLGVIAIEHKPTEAMWLNTQSEDSTLLNGERLFKNHRVACHAVNMVGGRVGPEFNVPKNITEYWQQEHFIGFAKSPQNYRFGSRMKASGLDSAQLTEIYRYLTAMKDVKLCSNYNSCRQIYDKSK